MVHGDTLELNNTELGGRLRVHLLDDMVEHVWVNFQTGEDEDGSNLSEDEVKVLCTWLLNAVGYDITIED